MRTPSNRIDSPASPVLRTCTGVPPYQQVLSGGNVKQMATKGLGHTRGASHEAGPGTRKGHDDIEAYA